jgi:hypothetical protein
MNYKLQCHMQEENKIGTLNNLCYMIRCSSLQIEVKLHRIFTNLNPHRR